ncbi:hypothetical protein OPT61_g7974 [Boeremia exigua]|uniref:Uncharacterized protein n=1 Tax=Boeremia exigua TaxID=749465 RepID=A0ACC2I0G0_9PLEO|nr:hypothetical protein OPT61_g7974 [Boeremia exigua]
MARQKLHLRADWWNWYSAKDVGRQGQGERGRHSVPVQQERRAGLPGCRYADVAKSHGSSQHARQKRRGDVFDCAANSKPNMQHQNSQSAGWYPNIIYTGRGRAGQRAPAAAIRRRVMTGGKTRRETRRLFGLLGEEGDEVVAVLGLLETTKGHLGAGDVLLGVLEVLEQRVLVPGDALLLVGVRVRVAVDLASLAAEQAVQHGADLVALPLLQGVALCAARLEEVGTLLSIAWWLLVGSWETPPPSRPSPARPPLIARFAPVDRALRRLNSSE